MYQLFNENPRFVSTSKTVLSLTGLIIALVLATAACHTTSDDHCIDCHRIRPVTYKAIIYGKIDSVTVNNAKHLAVFVLRNSDECTDSIHLSCMMHFGWTSGSGEYSEILYIPKYGKLSFDVSLDVALVSYTNKMYHTLTNSTVKVQPWKYVEGYDSLLARSQNYKINFRSHPPFDSVRVNFFLRDSTK
jgi:hypothetical protein